MSEAKPNQGMGEESNGELSPVEQAARVVVEWTEAQGFIAMPLYFAVSIGAIPGSGQLSAIGGRLRHHFAEALQDAAACGGAVGFIVNFGSASDPHHSQLHATATKERDNGLEPGSLPDEPRNVAGMH